MEIKKKFRPDPNLKLMDQTRQVLRYYHYAYRTEQTYCDWIVRYIKFFNCQKHPKDMGKREIEMFLSHLAIKENVAASTQRQALNAIIFLYKQVLDMPIDESIEHTRAKRHFKIKLQGLSSFTLTCHHMGFCRFFNPRI
jgi:hypothetical protein